MRKLPECVYISLLLTDFCRNGCSHCIYAAGPNGPTFMEMEMVNSVLDHLAKSNFGGRLYLSGGEPFDHPEFERVVEEAALGPYRTVIPTNCRFIGEDCSKEVYIVGKLRSHDRVQLRLSVDKYHLERDPFLRGRIKRWESIANTAALRRGREYAYKWAADSFPALLAFVRQMGLEDLAADEQMLFSEWNLLEARERLSPRAVDFIVLSPEGVVYRNNYEFCRRTNPQVIENLPKIIRMAQVALDTGGWGQIAEMAGHRRSCNG